jgi:hypothetical protein
MDSDRRDEPRPLWVASRSINPGDDPHWRTDNDKGRASLRDLFLAYYDSLPHTEQIAYCDRWSAPQPWITLFLHPELDEVAAEADFEMAPVLILAVRGASSSRCGSASFRCDHHGRHGGTFDRRASCPTIIFPHLFNHAFSPMAATLPADWPAGRA